MKTKSLCYKNFTFGLAKAILLPFMFLVMFVQTAQAVNETKTVGATGANYATLMAAFDAINTGALTGNITLQIIDNTTETLSASLSASGTGNPGFIANYLSVTIYPTVSGKTIYGNLAQPVIYLYGADNVTIDGRLNRQGTTSDLTITNDTRQAIAFYKGATNNTIRYCTLKGSMQGSTNGGVIHFYTESSGVGNNTNIIEYNNITSTNAGLTSNAIYSAGSATVYNSGNIIRYNNIYNVWKSTSSSAFIKLGNYNSDWSFIGNSMYNTENLNACSSGGEGIYISGATSNMTVNNNYIGGSAPQCGGTALTHASVGNVQFLGIFISSTGNNSVQGNTIKNISWTITGATQFTAITMTFGNYECGTVAGNIIGSSSGTGSIVFTAGSSGATMTGIFISNIAVDKTVNCKNNVIGSITTANSNSLYSVTTSGISTWTSVVGNINISDNLIGSTDTPNSIFASSPSTGGAEQVHGILSHAKGSTVISGNSISNLSSAQTTINSGATVGIQVSEGVNTISNNTINYLSNSNLSTMTPGNGNLASVTGIAVANTAAKVNTVTGNTIHNLTNSNASFSGYVVGISYEGSTTEGAISKNFIHDLFVTGASSTSGNISGIYVYKGVAVFSNNIVSLGGDTKTNATGYYVEGTSAADNVKLYFNTAYIGGSLASGSANLSYGIYSKTSTPTRDFRDNLLVNARSTTGSANTHYAIYYNQTAGTLTANYNDYYVSGTGGILGYYGGNKSTIELLRTATGQDVNSLNANPLFANAGGTIASNYIPGTSLPGETLGIPTDYAGTTREFFTMGAYEAVLQPIIPSAPTVNNPHTTSLDVAVNANGNPVANQFAIQDSDNSLYIQADGTRAATAVWQTAADWGTKTVTGLTSGTTYSFRVKARNSINVESDFGPTASGVPGDKPTVIWQAGHWLETQPAGDVNKMWQSVGVSSNGAVQLAAAFNGRLYRSTNGGTTWSETQPAGDLDKTWNSVAVSSNGTTMLAAMYNGRIYKTTNSGLTWSETTPTGTAENKQWGSVALSADGSIMLAAVQSGRVYKSTDTGTSWTETMPSGTGANKYWISVAMSSTGEVMMAAVNQGLLYITTNSGTSWSQATPVLYDRFWQATAVSSDGSTMLVATNDFTDGRLYKSSNSGANWIETMPVGNTDKRWQTVSVSSDGLTMLAAIQGGRMYKSYDGGTTWGETQPAGDNDKSWSTVSISGDATSGLAGVMSGRLYRIAPVIVANITTNSASANGKITATNGPDATSRGAIIYPYTDTDKIIGGADVTNISNPGSFGTGIYPVSFNGLTPGTHYNARAHATNTYGTGYSDRTGFWTLADVPLAPTVDNPTATTLDVTVNGGTNSIDAEYAINETSTTKFVQADGTLGVTEVWQTASGWGAKTVIGLTTGTTYEFKVKARNGDHIETAFSPTTSGIPVDHPYVEWQPVTVWGETQPAGDANKDWYALSISNNGNVQLAAVNPGRIYRSANGGTAWSEVQPAGDANKTWSSVAVSNDGTTMLACVQDGRLYKSTDGGITWSETKPNGNNNEIWTSVSLSASGDTMLVSRANGRVYKSINKGINWNQTYPAGDVSKYWQLVAISANGQGLLAGITGGRLYKSNNGGTNWAETQPAGNADKSWRAISVSADGLTMIAGVFNGRLYKSNDGGNNWSETQPDGNSNKNWRSVSVSADGLTMLAAVYQGRIYKSVDGGTSWSETQPAGNNFQKWSSVALSSDAGRMLAGVEAGRLYRNSAAIFTSITSTSALANGNITATNTVDATNRGAIIYPYTDTDKVIGDANVTNISNPGTFGTGTYPVSFTGLAPGTHYNARAHATNTFGTGYSDRTGFWTLPVVPLAPTVNNPTATTLDVTVNGGTNSADAEYAINETSTTKFVQADGTLGVTEVWQTAAIWGAKTVSGLTTGTTYEFKVKARNADHAETAFSLTASGIPVDHPYVEWQSINWSETQPAGDADFEWEPAAVSADGSMMVAAVRNGRIYKSTDGGTIWSETQPAGNVDKIWKSVSLSSDGTIMLAAASTGRLYKSINGGTTWSETQPAGNADKNWTSVSVSANGLTMLAQVYYGRNYKTTNGGTSWSETQPAGNVLKAWNGVAVSSDGNTMLAAVSGGRIYKSTNGGTTWSETQPAGNVDKFWQAIALSSDGSTMLAAAYSGRVYKSTDSGNTWAETLPGGNSDNDWFAVALSGNGNTMLAAVRNGNIYKSTNGGTSWGEMTPAGANNEWWITVSMSSDGLLMLATASQGRLYRTTSDITINISNTAASATGIITGTNGADATSRGAIIYPYTDTDKMIGDANVTNISNSGTFGAGSYPVSFTGLAPGTHYNARAHATNTYGTGYSDRTSFWTLASVPDAPTVNNPTATTLDVAVNVNGNPATTVFAIHETTQNKFIQADGTLGDTVAWQTATAWGTKTITGLTTGSTYTFEVKARNGGNVETAYGSSTNGIPEAAPTVTTQAVTIITATSATGNGNITTTNGVSPTNRGVIYYLYSGTDKINGDAGVSNVDENGSPTFTTGAFTRSLTGLSANTRYNARAHATNTVGTGYGTRTDFWTLANIPDAPTVNNPTATTLDVAVNANGNPVITEFVIHETSTDKYVQANGTLGATAVWATATSWATKTITGLTTGSTYTFEVKARNGGNVETAYGATTSETTCKNPTSAGSIGSSQFTCVGSIVNTFTSIADASGYSGTLEYKWQKSTTGELTDFSDIASTNAATYNPVSVSLTTWYKRLAKVNCKTEWVESNVVKLTINSTIAVTNTNNSGVGSLRYAIDNLCNNGTIIFDNSLNGQIITLTTGTLTIDKNIILDNSNHANGIIISGAGDNITINTGKVLTLASNSRITVIGAIKNNAGKTGLVLESGTSFIQNNVDLQATAKRYLNSGWHLFGTPFKKYMITMSTITPAGGSLQVKPYTNGTNWQPNISSSYSYLIPTTGYAIKPSANYTLSLSGNLYYSPLTPDYTNSLIYNGTSGTQSWNLMANPYTSYINWKLMGKTNINQSLYLWDNTLNPTLSPTTNAAYFRTYNALSNVGVPSGTTPYIAPLQGFFVKATYTNPKLTFPPSARTHSNSAYYKDASTEIVLRLKAETEEGADELVICSNTAAKQGFEEFDSEKMLTANPMELYSYAKTGEKLTINTIENTQTIIPLGIKGMAGSKAKITAFALETSNQVYLEDRHKGKLIRLSENTEYSFEFPTNELQGRFFIRFGDVNSPITSSDVKVFKNNNKLNVIAQTGENIEQLEVYSLTGACLFKANSNSNMFTTSLDLATGVYMIRVKTNITTQNVKLNWK